MGLLNLFFGKTGRYVSESAFRKNLNKQEEMNGKTLEALRKYNVTEDKEKKVEYFFYTNTIQKAEAFSKELITQGYSVQHGQAAGEKRLFVITGWTTDMKMSLQVLSEWTKQMCELGHKFDCDFDGWGTNVD